MTQSKKFFGLNEPLPHSDHARPRTRRELIAQGFMAGGATIAGTSLLSSPFAHGLSIPDNVVEQCGINFEGAGKIPLICFDLAGGANIAGSNVLVGGRGGQMDFLDDAGYSKQGLPSDMTPSSVNPDAVDGSYVNTELGLAFHTQSAVLDGIFARADALTTRANTNGAVIAARSENDTGNNPHNPMYAANLYGSRGALVALCGSQSSVSGGNSMAPAMFLNSEVRPTKIDRPSDVTGLVDVGDLVGLLTTEEIVAVMETSYHLSAHKMSRVSTTDVIRDAVRCKYLESAGLAERYSNPSNLDPMSDAHIVGGDNSIFTVGELNSGPDRREFLKTASVMKMVLEGYAGAGTITMGGYDYHTGDRATGEVRDKRVGECIGACLEYAQRMGKPLMIYVYSDGSVFSNGAMDTTILGAGKGVWTGDSQQTAASYFLVYNPGGRPQLINDNNPLLHQQIGYMRPSGDVETSSHPAANNVNQLVQLVLLNYMALHGDQGAFAQLFSDNGMNHGLGANLDRLTAFQPLVGSGLSSVNSGQAT